MLESRLKTAQDPEELEEELEEDKDAGPTEEELVEEVEESPAYEWEKYLQPIIRLLKMQFGDAEVSLVAPRMVNAFGSPEYGFNIVGEVGFPAGRPPDILLEFGEEPLFFKAYINSDGELSSDVAVFSHVGDV